ncbi:caM kinase-like vesicle-associated protein isoform X4 [Anopheles arabiensis]|uniref:caM kinase-like vesicle-associated protein isoform X4 n=1 Tax=Anopheles arabiensis TaxID=7173 RepID=UPI001AADBCB4|nr:caM kinase-like vesicle-associated protein isoform X4 [Anopheles arabiensis]
MIHVDETDPLGDIPPAFPYREVEIKRGIDPKQIYELSSELGRGKFGVVYKCKEKSTGVRLAAKFIQIVKKGDRRNIEREVHMMNVLHHSKIAQLYAAYEFDRTFCVMMELVEGGELFDRVLDEKFVLTEKACSIFMRQICDAVAYIHGNNIIHLDMKPENILCLTESGNRIKIIDFGLAREYDPDNKLQVLFGTPEFVAPEVVNFEAISFATDMWSVGVIAYVLVSGLSPFAGEDDIQTMGNITIGRYDFLDEAFDNVSEEAIDFINRCLVKEQKERLTAEDALKHKWIKRKPQYHPTNRRPSLTNSFKPILLESNNNSSNVTNTEIAKDNLKELVGKWDETPNNRYAFEQDTENIIAPSGETVQLRRPTLPELAGLANGSNTSGSRRGSIARDSDSVASSSDTTASVCTDPAPSPTTTPLHLLHPASPAQPNPPRTVGSAGDGDAVTDTHRDKVRDDLRKLSDLLKLSLTNVKALDGVEQSAPNAPTATTPTTPAPALELDSELESLKSKVNTIRTSRAQNKLNELAQRPDFLANDPFKLPTFRFLPKSISLCNEDSVFKENYTKFCDRNASGRLSREQSQETTVSEKIDAVGTIVRKKSTTSSTTKKKKDPEGAATATTTTTTTTTFSSTPSGKIASTTTVRKTIVKQQKIVVEDASSSVTTVGTSESSRSRSIAPVKSLDVSSSSTASDSSKLTHSASIKRTKFRVNQLSSRDVPVAINSVARRYLERSGVQDDLSTSVARLPRTLSPTGPGQTTLDDTVMANNLRNSALRLRSSVSVDWDAMEAVENRSMKTINTFLKRHAVASSAVKQIQAQLEATITTHK